MKILLLLGATLILSNCYSQLDWVQTYGTSGEDRGGSIYLINNNSYVLTTVENYGGSGGNTTIRKIDLQGNSIWSQTYGNNYEDECGRMVPTSDGGFVLSGWTRSYASAAYTGGVNLYSASWVFKVDSGGNQVWTRSMGGNSYGDNYPGGVTLSLSEQPVLWGQVQHHTGCTNYSTRLRKINTDGSDIWSYCQTVTDGGSAITRLNSVNEYIIGRKFASQNSSSIIFKKHNDSGTEIWSMGYNPGDGNDVVYGLKPSFDGGFYAYGSTSGTGFQANDIFLSKFDSNGNLIWEHFFGASENDWPGDLIETSANELGLVATTNSNSNTTSNIWIMSLDTLGNVLFEDFYGTGNEVNAAHGLTVAPDGDYVVSGRTNASGNNETLIFKIGCTPDMVSDVQTACDSFTWIDGNIYTSSNNTATYTLTNASNCDSIVTLDLTINTVDNQVTQTGATLTADQTGATYQWLDCDNSYAIIAGETNQSYTPTNVSGNYAVEVTLNGCVDTSACYHVDFTGIEELTNTKKELVKIIDFMGRETEFKPNTPLIFIYSDGTRERAMEIEE